MHNQQKLSLIITKYSLLSSALSRLAVQSLYAIFGAHVKTYNRILDKREYLMIIFLISSRNQAKFMTILSFDLQVWPWPSTYFNKCFKWHFYSTRRTTASLFWNPCINVQVITQANRNRPLHNAYTPNWSCNNYVSLTTSRLDKNCEKFTLNFLFYLRPWYIVNPKLKCTNKSFSLKCGILTLQIQFF